MNVPLMVEKLEQALIGTSFEILVVDDDSPDRTWEIAEKLAESRPHLRVIRRLHNHGLSPAVMDGFAASRGKYMVVMDADMQHDESVLPLFVSAFENGADIVVGSRKVSGGKVEDWSPLRKFISFGAGTLAKLMLPNMMSDPMSGYFAIRKNLYEELGPGIDPKGFKILLEFLVRAQGKKLVEVGYTFRGRQFGESKLSTNVMLDYLSALYDLRFGKVISRRFMKYLVVGISGIVVNQFFVWVGKGPLRLTDSYALALGIETSIVSNFFLNNYWTFRRNKLRGFKKTIRGLATFNMICLGGAAINYAIAMFVTEHFSLNLYTGNMLGIVMATAWNYLVNSSITWTSQN